MGPKLTVAEYLTKTIEISEKTQKQIAQEAGYEKPNILSMMKQGLVKVPVERAPALARALNVDPAYLLNLVLREYMPAAWSEIEKHLGPTLSENERSLLTLYREVAAEGEVEMDDARRECVKSCLSR